MAPGTECVQCGKEEAPNYSVTQGGFVCKNCKNTSPDAVSLLPGTKKAIAFVLNQAIKKVFSFRVSDEVLEQMETIADQCFLLHINENFKAQEFIKKI